MATATRLAQRVLSHAGAWTCAHPDRLRFHYRMDNAQPLALLCVLCACELSDRLRFPMSPSHLYQAVQTVRMRYMGGRWCDLYASDWWADHVDDCQDCKHARDALDMCHAGMRRFLEIVYGARRGEA